MFNLASGQGRWKFQPEEYIGYFEDLNFHLTLRWGQRGHCDTVSKDQALRLPLEGACNQNTLTWRGRIQVFRPKTEG